MIRMDAIDRQIIQVTQSGLPLVEQPYVEVAKQVGISEEEVMQRITAMQEKDIIRRIGVVPNHYALGYKANGMTVWDVPDEHIDELGKKMASLADVYINDAFATSHRGHSSNDAVTKHINECGAGFLLKNEIESTF